MSGLGARAPELAFLGGLGLRYGQPIRDATLVPYRHTVTFDALPASETGTYFADGILVSSTLFGEPL